MKFDPETSERIHIPSRVLIVADHQVLGSIDDVSLHLGPGYIAASFTGRVRVRAGTTLPSPFALHWEGEGRVVDLYRVKFGADPGVLEATCRNDGSFGRIECEAMPSVIRHTSE